MNPRVVTARPWIDYIALGSARRRGKRADVFMARAVISSNLLVSTNEVEALSRRVPVKYMLGSTGLRDILNSTGLRDSLRLITFFVLVL